LSSTSTSADFNPDCAERRTEGVTNGVPNLLVRLYPKIDEFTVVAVADGVSDAIDNMAACDREGRIL
jgi:hypothetical protein